MNPAARSGFGRVVFLGAALGVALLGALLVNSCSTFSGTTIVPLEIPGAHYVGSSACRDCHGEIVRIFPASAHARLHFTKAGLPDQSGCESCHGPGSRHIESADHRFILNPRKDPGACFRCHQEIHAEFNLPQRHPVIEGRMNCVQCHDPHGGDSFKPSGGLAMARQNESCASCHREQARPFVFEHEALREGCTICHNAHGSVNRKLLIAADSNLCLRCHQQVIGPGVPTGEFFIGKTPHAALMQLGSCWSAGCHTAVHGSNVHPRMLY